MKPFDEELEKRTRKIIGRVYPAMLSYLGAKHLKDEPANPTDYKSYDKICALPTGEELWVEFEVRDMDTTLSPVWNGPSMECFKRGMVHVPYRKKDSLAKLYVTTNNVGTAFAVTLLTHVKASETETMDVSNEQDAVFFKVPSSLWDIYMIENNTLIATEWTVTERYLK